MLHFPRIGTETSTEGPVVQADPRSSASPHVLRATAGQLEAITSALAGAFVIEPMMTWPLGDITDPAAAIAASFRIWDVANIDLGVVYQVADCAGAAVWVAPDQHGRWLSLERRARPAIHALSADGGARYERMWNWIEEREPADPVWYLDRVGVDPSRQGDGLGKALVTFGLARAAEAGVAAFLETATESNVEFYRSLGFRVVDDATVPGGGPRIWFLRCDPA
jgi:ribosomal protein S18 acetylase RimI-like enzyme